jgi:hypothetical protein
MEEMGISELLRQRKAPSSNFFVGYDMWIARPGESRQSEAQGGGREKADDDVHHQFSLAVVSILWWNLWWGQKLETVILQWVDAGSMPSAKPARNWKWVPAQRQCTGESFCRPPTFYSGAPG